eukprot:jgi/Tetstr1/464214/TSEL_009019.t1
MEGSADPDWVDIGRRKRLADRVADLSKTEHEQILRILHSNGLRYTRNNNGVFCDITRAPTGVLDMIDRFIEYSARSADLLEEERRAAIVAPAQKPKEKKDRERAAPQYRADRVKAFANSMMRTKNETSAQKRKEACRYQQLRKKYLREVSCKTTFANELRPEQ